jgi:hypothetical protein
MKLDGKMKGGLAWAGLVVILAVPAADMLVGKSGANTAATATAVTASVPSAKPTLKLPVAKTPAVTSTDPIQTASVQDGAVVDKFVKSGKKLPSYISDGDAVATETKQPVPTLKPVTTTPAISPTEVATAPVGDPPIPLPRSARPKATQVASLPTEEQPLIVDETKVKQQERAAVVPFPMSDEDNVVTGDQLEEWDSGSLADYLERKGLLTETSQQASDQYDPDGFYLEDGPNKPKRPKKNLEFFLF